MSVALLAFALPAVVGWVFVQSVSVERCSEATHFGLRCGHPNVNFRILTLHSDAHAETARLVYRYGQACCLKRLKRWVQSLLVGRILTCCLVVHDYSSRGERPHLSASVRHVALDSNTPLCERCQGWRSVVSPPLCERCQGWQHLAGGTANDELLGALSPRCHRDTAGTLYGFDRSSGPAIDRQGADLPTYRPTYRQTHILRAYLPWRRIASLRTEPRARKRDTLGCPLIGTACHRWSSSWAS